MHNHYAYGSGYWVWGIGIALVWWLLGSALLWLTWNRVIGGVAKVKAAKYWQALLFLFTVAFLCAPRFCPLYHGCHHGPCPYEGAHGHMMTPDKGE